MEERQEERTDLKEEAIGGAKEDGPMKEDGQVIGGIKAITQDGRDRERKAGQDGKDTENDMEKRREDTVRKDTIKAKVKLKEAKATTHPCSRWEAPARKKVEDEKKEDGMMNGKTGYVDWKAEDTTKE